MALGAKTVVWGRHFGHECIQTWAVKWRKAADIKMNLLPDIHKTLEWLMKLVKARNQAAKENMPN